MTHYILRMRLVFKGELKAKIQKIPFSTSIPIQLLKFHKKRLVQKNQ